MKSFSCCLVLLFAFRLPTGGAAPSPDKLLASDTLGVITVPDFSQAKKTYGQWPLAQFWNDAALKPFREKLVGKVKSDLLKPLEQEFGIKWSDLEGLAQGQVTLAVTQNGWDGKSDQSPGFLFLLDAKDKSEALKSTLVEMKKKWADAGKPSKSETIRDLEFTTLIFTSEDFAKVLEKAFPDPNEGHESLDEPKSKKTPRKLQWLVGQSDSLLIVGNSAKDIEKLLIRQSGGAVPSLAEHTSFALNYSSMFRDSLVYGWVNIKTLTATLAKQLSNPNEAPPNLVQGFPKSDKLLATLGLAGLETVSFNLRDTADGCLTHLLVSVPESNRKGLVKLLSFEAKDANPPRFVPGDAVKFTRLRRDFQTVWATLENTLAEISPQMAGAVKMMVDFAGKDKDPNFDLRKNLIGNLGDDFISYEKNPRKITLEGLNSPPSLYLISSPKAEQLAAAIKAVGSVMPQPPSKLKERDFLGRKVFTLSLPPTPNPQGGKPIDQNLSYAASGGYVALSTDVAMLEEYLRSSESSGKTLSETAGLAEAAQKVGGMGTGLFSFENQNETTRAKFEALKKESGSLADLFNGSPLKGRLGIGENDRKLKDWADFSLLPPHEAVAKYFSYAVWAGSVNSEGISFKWFSPIPPQLKK